jgi:hypothetical protein
MGGYFDVSLKKAFLLRYPQSSPIESGILGLLVFIRASTTSATRTRMSR